MPNVTLHPGQSTVYKDIFVEKNANIYTVIASRGWGKSYFAAITAMTAVHELLSLPDTVPNKNVYIIAPTHDQVTDIYYPILVYDLQVPAIKSSRELGRFLFPNNVELRLISYEAIERLRGKGAYLTVQDEMCSWKKGLGPKAAWEGIIQPAIVTRWGVKKAKLFGAPSPGRSLTITTPKGYDYVYDLYNLAERSDKHASYHFDYTTSPYLDADEIEALRYTVDPLQFAREYLASFEESGINVFYCFDRKVHVNPNIKDFEEGEDIHCGIDFNVDKQCTSIFALRGKQMQYIDEVKGHPDTEALAKYLRDRWPKNIIYAYPDPTGKSRKTSAPVGTTDFSILKSYKIRVRARKGSPPIVDSTNAVNRMLRTAAGGVNMYFHPRCSGTIMSMERTKWVENSDFANIDKKEDVEHFSDNVRYSTEFLFPVQHRNNVVSRGFGF